MQHTGKKKERDLPYGTLLEAAVFFHVISGVQMRGKLCFEAVLGEEAPLITVILSVPCVAACNDFTFLFSGIGNY